MHKLKLPKVSRSEVTGSIKIITKWIYKGLFIVYCSFNFGKENSTITITEKKIQIFVILIIYHNSPSVT